jgi:hypothetical protein
MSARQLDLFQDDEQADLFGEDSPTPVYRADPDKVRQELHKILAEARAAQTMPGMTGTFFTLPHHFPADDELAPRGGGHSAALRI